MKLPDSYGKRLRSKNFRRVNSHAAYNINYDEKKKIIEIEYKNGRIYHYLDMGKNDWKKLLKYADKGEGFGAYINQKFKPIFENSDDYKFYELIGISS
jgi:hypothetical protein